MKYDSGRKLREQQRTERHSRCASLQSPATPPRDNTTAACTAACWENWRGTRVFVLNGGPKTRSDRLGLNLLRREKLGCLCRERENLRDISASLFFKLPSCFWNPWAPFTPWLYLYHKNTISGSSVGARQWNTFQTKQMQALQMGAKQQIKHHFVLANKDCKKEDSHLFPLKYCHNTNQHKSFTNTELYWKNTILLSCDQNICAHRQNADTHKEGLNEWVQKKS